MQWHCLLQDLRFSTTNPAAQKAELERLQVQGQRVSKHSVKGQKERKMEASTCSSHSGSGA